MQELIEKLQAEHGLTAEQSHGILDTIKNYIKEKFPMVEGMIDNLFHHNAGSETTTSDATPTAGENVKPNVAGDSFINEG